MRSRVLFLTLLAGCFPSGQDCVVDETGYLDPACESPGRDVDDAATGELPDGAEADDLGGVVYTAASVLGADPVLVTVIGLPGTLAVEVALEARVLPDGAPVPAAVFGSGFVATVDARLGDTVRVTDAGGGTVAEVLLDDDLSSAAPPAAPADSGEFGGVVSDDGAGGAGSAGGVVQVGDGALPFVAAPYIAYVAITGASVRVEAGQADVTLPAEPGDELCLVGLDGDRTSLATCVIVGG